jgi:hypothetical protein
VVTPRATTTYHLLANVRGTVAYTVHGATSRAEAIREARKLSAGLRDDAADERGISVDEGEAVDVWPCLSTFRVEDEELRS